MKILRVILGIVWVVIGLAILVKINYWLPIVATLFNSGTYADDVPLVIYWIAVFFMIVLVNFVIPIGLIMSGFQQDE